MDFARQRTHRHFLAAPLFLFAILLPVSLSALPGSLLGSSAALEQERPVPSLSGTSVQSMPDGVQVLLFEDAVLDTASTVLAVREGSILVSAEGIARVSVSSSMEAIAFNGLFHVSRYGDRVTVAALTSPVLLSQNGRKMLIPAGRLWRSGGMVLPSLAGGLELWIGARSTDAVPRSFLRDQLRSSALLPPASDAWLPPSRVRAPLLTSSAVPRFPAAAQRFLQEQEEIALGLLRHAVEERDGFAVGRLLQQPEYGEVFAADRAQRAILLFLSRSAEFSPVALPLLTHLSATSDLWLLFSIHPRVNTAAWALIEPELSKEDELLCWMTLPEADFQPVAFDDVILRRWIERLSAYSDLLEDSQAFLSLFIRHTDAAVARMDASHYPERAERLIAAVHDFVQPFLPMLPQQSQDTVRGWEQRGKVPLLSVTFGEEAQPASSAQTREHAPQQSPQPASVPSEQVEAQAKALLADAGALFTLRTQVAHAGGSLVQVRGLVFSTSLRDRVFDFLLDTERGEVRGISEGVQAYPYALPFQQFVAWASR
ncbi:MAG: hypothetical protein PHU04_02530 [Candidatus Peribacteraceae bacterium]|nr:hypothetical protein [Candidatus Peribacteraceae bacterium]